jgi:general secretion pathway protein J
VDSAREDQELTRDFLTQVEEFKMEFYTNKTWKKDWLVDGDERLAMPEAIKVTIVLKDFGELHRLFPMPRFEVSAGDDERGGGQQGDRGGNNGGGNTRPPGDDDRGRDPGRSKTLSERL